LHTRLAIRRIIDEKNQQSPAKRCRLNRWMLRHSVR
jgi:hypothetical protein